MSRVLLQSSLVFFFGSLCLAACMHKIPNPPKATTSNTIPDSTICFERDILPIFINNCTQSNCHSASSAQEGYILTDYNSIVRKGIKKGNATDSKIYEVLIEKDAKDRMPLAPNPALSSAQIKLIRQWIDDGALNTTNCTNADCDSNLFTYSGAISATMNEYCVGCHNTNTRSGGISLDNYNDVKTVVNKGRLLGAVKRENGFSAMPQSGPPLSDCKILQIEKWIANNAPNN